MLDDQAPSRHIQKLLGHQRLETTTLYTRLARRPAGPATSPLDALAAKARATGPKLRSGGSMRLKLEPRRTDGPARRAADVSLVISASPQPVLLGGIVAREARPGWVCIDLPPLEDWKEQLCWLAPAQRDRLESADFYQQLQELLAKRLLALPVAS